MRPSGETLDLWLLLTKLPGCLEATASLYTAEYFKCKTHFCNYDAEIHVDFSNQSKFKLRDMLAHASQKSLLASQTCVYLCIKNSPPVITYHH